MCTIGMLDKEVGIDMAKSFIWNAWDFDCDGVAYIIAKSECPTRENVPNYIIREDCLHEECKDGMVVEEGWCKYQVRTDWENGDGKPRGGYCVQRGVRPRGIGGKAKTGWFPVWIVRQGEWY